MALYDEDDSSGSDVTGGGDGGDSNYAQLGGLFSSLGTTISSVYRSVSGPQTVKPGTVIVNPNGTTSVAGSVFSGQGGSGLMFLGLALLVVVVLLMRR